MNSNHKVPVIKITEIRKHPNADTLGLVDIGGYQVVVKLGEFAPGQLAAYVQPDSVLPDTKEFEWFWAPNVFEGGTPEKKRRVTVRKFRKEWSEGLLLALKADKDGFFVARDPKSGVQTRRSVAEGDDLAEVLGIEHYNPPEPGETLERGTSIRQSRTRPKSLKGWAYFIWNWTLRVGSFGQYDPWGNCGGANETAPRNTPPVYDVETFKNYTGVFEPGEEVIVTEKIHGSNARFMFQESLIGGKMYAGSRKLWKSEKSKCVWRTALEQNPWIEKWCREHPGYTLYGEVVPTQGGFNYGTESGQVKFFVFDILTPSEGWINVFDYWSAAPGEWDTKRINLLCQASVGMLIWVPVLFVGAYDETKIKTYVDGPSNIKNAQHIREGIVIKTAVEKEIRGLGRAQLKIVSNKYLEKAAA